MALRLLQFGIVFVIGYRFGHAQPPRRLESRDAGLALELGVQDVTRPEPQNPARLEVPNIVLSIRLRDPDDVTVPKGQPATLKCAAESAHKPVRYAWLRNGVPLPANDTRTVVRADGSLHVPKVVGGKKANVTGDYQCLVSNPAGAVLSNVAKLRVASFGKEFTLEPNSLNVTEQETVVLHCKIHSVPTAEIHWEVDDSSLPHNTRYVPLSSGALLIKNIQVSDSGSYRCRASNVILKEVKYSNIANLTVTVPERRQPKTPTILPLDMSPNVTVTLGEPVQLHCAISGWPIPTFQWRHDDKVVGNSSVLQLAEAEAKDAGNYTCTGTNAEGQATRRYSLLVHQKPYFKSTPMSKSYPSAIVMRLNCTADGVPKPHIHWLKNGKPLVMESRMSNASDQLIFSQTFKYDSGIYQCVASNEAGRSWKAAEILINVPELSPPENVQCRPYNESSVCITWQLPSNVSAKAYTIDSINPGLNHPGELTNNTFLLWQGLNTSTTYKFYVRLYSNVASDKSDIVSCQTAKVPSRQVQIQMHNTNNSVVVLWEPLITDTPCGGQRGLYKVQWRRVGSPTTNTNKTEKTKHIVKNLIPGASYEFKVTSLQYPNDKGHWTPFTLPNPDGVPVPMPDVSENATHVTQTPKDFDATPLSATSLKLTWSLDKEYFKYYMVCYVPVNEQKDCKDGKLVKTSSNTLMVNKLKPNTRYEFKIRPHNLEGEPGPFSQALEVLMPDVPSPVVNLKYKIINETTACVYWQAPVNKNGLLQNYVISYTPDRNWRLEEWINVTVPSRQRKSAACWTGSEDTASLYLRNLDPDKHYTVLVRAESNVGIGKPTVPIVVSTKFVQPDKQNESKGNGTIGVLVGIVVSLFCVICCVSMVLVRRGCVKRRAASRARHAASGNYYPAARYASQSSSVQVRWEDPCVAEADAHEVVHLVREEHPSNIPPMMPSHLDTKGPDEFPNGQANGCVKPHMNGHLSDNYMCHITENPQYYAYECNLHNKPDTRDMEGDRNSNVPTSKFYDLYALFENAKRSKVTSTKECSPHFEYNISRNKEESSSDLNSTIDNDDASLNATQLTCLDYPIANNHRRVSPILGPNG